MRGVCLTVFLFGWSMVVIAADLASDVIGDGRINVPLLNFDVYLATAPEEGQYKLLKDPERLKEVLHHLYLNRVLAAEARELGLDKDPRIQAEIANFVERKLALARLDRIRSEPVPDLTTSARAYYKAHYDEFMRPPRVDVSHILIQWKGKRSRDKAREIAEEVREKLLEGGDFAELADLYSEDPSVKSNHGRLGWISPNQVVTAFRKQVFKLKPGEISPVFETPFGFHVAKVWETEAASRIPFEEVKDRIVAKLAHELREDRVQQYLEALRKRPVGIEKKVLEPYVAEKLEELTGKVKALPKPVQSVAEPLTRPAD